MLFKIGFWVGILWYRRNTKPREVVHPLVVIQAPECKNMQSPDSILLEQRMAAALDSAEEKRTLRV